MTVRERINAGEYRTKLPHPKWTDNNEDKRTKLKAYYDDVNKLTNEFKINALKELGIYQHPKASRCWELAWDYGHSAGFIEVFNYLDDLSELMK